MVETIRNPHEIAPPGTRRGGLRIYWSSHVMLTSNFPNRLTGRPVNYEAIKASAFADQGIVVASINDPRLDAFERQYLQNIGNKLFGKQSLRTDELLTCKQMPSGCHSS